MIFNILKVILALILLLTIIYFVGPRVEKPILNNDLPKLNFGLLELEKWINDKESSLSNIKTDNEARIIWSDSIPKQTDYSLVYLHGWSASQGEGDPVHRLLAERYGFNLYLARLAGHGIKEERTMCDLTADQLYDSAKEAIAIGKKIGKKVIVIGTSTGCTLALPLSAGDPDVAALILYSPNIALANGSSSLLSGPWGVQLAKALLGEYLEYEPENPLVGQYWTNKYCSKALTQLQVLVDQTMVKETFQGVTQPVFMGYYYKDEENQDQTVSVPAMLKMFEELGTENQLKRKVAFPDVGEHVIASYISSKDLESVKSETFKFFDEVLKLPVRNGSM